MITVYGINLSTFTRKVRLALVEKGLDYQLEVAPMGSPAIRALNPLGKIPVLRDGNLVVPDSSVIVAYLERRWPERPLWPADAAALARALWIEEFADTSLREAILPWFAENFVKPVFQGVAGDAAALARAGRLRDAAFDYLEREIAGRVPAVAAPLTIADIAVGAQLVTYRQGDGVIDAARWPGLSRFHDALVARPAWARMIEEEQATIAAARARKKTAG